MATAPDLQSLKLDYKRNPMLPWPFQIKRIKHETEDTFTVELQPLGDLEEFAFQPGQFNMVYIYGVGEIPISISGDPANARSLVHTTRAVGTVTKAMDKMRRGDILGIRGPFGTQWPIKQAVGHDIVIVSGGIGLAPLRPAIYEVLAHRDQFGKIVLLYGTRTPSDVLFRQELEHWRARFDLEIYVTVDRAMSGWRGSVGVVTNLISRAPFDPRNTSAFVCGPEIMMRFTAMELHKRGVDNGHIYLSMERNMKCAIGFCGHCQFGPFFVCKDGPIFEYNRIKDMLVKWEL
jgi:NAD(P)H-flavin reductase